MWKDGTAACSHSFELCFLTSVIATSLNLPRSRREEALASICLDMRCGCLIAFSFISSDQKTSFQRRWGVPFSNPVLPFGELVLAQTQHAESAKLDHRLQPQRSLAIWLGRCEATGEHILAKANNTGLVKPLEGSTDLSVFKSISIPAPELASAASVKMAKEGDQPTDQQGGEIEA